MAATPSPNPTNLILLGVLGIGVYWFMSRRAGMPNVIYPTPAQNQQAYGADTSKVMKYQLLGGLVNKGLDFLGQRAAGQNPYSLADSYTGGTFGGLNPSGAGWGLSAANDGFAYNPASGSASDSIYSLI